jgi:hypothetical protein
LIFLTFPGKCSCYSGFLCYADCTCWPGCNHQYVGVILNGQRYFRVMDLRPDNPVLDTLVTFHFTDAPSRKERMRDHPEMLIASAKIKPNDAETLTKKKDKATQGSGTVSDPEMP